MSVLLVSVIEEINVGNDNSEVIYKSYLTSNTIQTEIGTNIATITNLTTLTNMASVVRRIIITKYERTEQQYIFG